MQAHAEAVRTPCIKLFMLKLAFIIDRRKQVTGNWYNSAS